MRPLPLVAVTEYNGDPTLRILKERKTGRRPLKKQTFPVLHCGDVRALRLHIARGKEAVCFALILISFTRKHAEAFNSPKEPSKIILQNPLAVLGFLSRTDEFQWLREVTRGRHKRRTDPKAVDRVFQ